MQESHLQNSDDRLLDTADHVVFMLFIHSSAIGESVSRV